MLKSLFHNTILQKKSIPKPYKKLKVRSPWNTNHDRNTIAYLEIHWPSTHVPESSYSLSDSDLDSPVGQKRDHQIQTKKFIQYVQLVSWKCHGQ